MNKQHKYNISKIVYDEIISKKENDFFKPMMNLLNFVIKIFTTIGIQGYIKKSFINKYSSN